MTRSVELTKELSGMKIDQYFMFAVSDLPRLDLVGPVFYRCMEGRSFSGQKFYYCQAKGYDAIIFLSAKIVFFQNRGIYDILRKMNPKTEICGFELPKNFHDTYGIGSNNPSFIIFCFSLMCDPYMRRERKGKIGWTRVGRKINRGG